MECGEAPLYRALATAIASNADMLDVAAVAERGPVPNLFLAAVHEVLLREHGEGLSQFYPTVTSNPACALGVGEVLSEFVAKHASSIENTLRSRLVQTNEVRRASAIFLALSWLAGEYDLSQIAVVEVGASAGLLLVFDRYDYAFALDSIPRAPMSDLVIETELIGTPTPPLELPEFVERIGIDLNLLDIHDEDDRRWLRALVWGDHPDRMAILDRAIGIARDVPMTMLEGDANRILPDTFRRLPPGLSTVVYHSHTLNQFSPEARHRLESILVQESESRDVYRIAMEYQDNVPTVAVIAYRAGKRMIESRIAEYDAHGAWLKWLGS